MLTDLVLLFANGLAKTIQTLSKPSRITIAIMGLFLFVAGVAGVILHELDVLYESRLQKVLLPASLFAIANGVGAIALLGVAYSSVDLMSFSGKVRDEAEIDRIYREREVIDEESGGAASGDISYSIRASLNELREYYVINKAQGRKSFGFSVTAIAIGFILITSGIAALIIDRSTNITVPVIASVAGLLSQFIGATSFYLYRKTLDQLNHYFRQLTDMQRIMLAIKLAEEASEPASQDGLRQIIVASLVASRRHVEQEPSLSQAGDEALA